MPNLNGFSSIANAIPLSAQSGASVVETIRGPAGKAARDFEATFLSLLLKEVRQSEGSDGLFAGDSGDIQGGLFDQYLGQHLADAGGVGLAAEILPHLLRSADPPRSTHSYAEPPLPPTVR